MSQTIANHTELAGPGLGYGTVDDAEDQSGVGLDNCRARPCSLFEAEASSVRR